MLQRLALLKYETVTPNRLSSERDAVEDDDADRGADDRLAELVGDLDDPQRVDRVHRQGDGGGDADGLTTMPLHCASVDVARWPRARRRRRTA